MTVGDLAGRYVELFGYPTRTRNKSYLRKRIAWRIQELAEGGLSPRALAKIEELAPLAPVRWRPVAPDADDGSPQPPAGRDPRLPKAGTVLVRTYKGIEHKVRVLEDGFEYNGRQHRSLSELAKLITGTPWNGFTFFNVQRRTQASSTQRAGT